MFSKLLNYIIPFSKKKILLKSTSHPIPTGSKTSFQKKHSGRKMERDFRIFEMLCDKIWKLFNKNQLYIYTLKSNYFKKFNVYVRLRFN
jgi:hypothetical protein